MFVKAFVVCSAFLFQTITCQCIGPFGPNPLVNSFANSLAAGLPYGPSAGPYGPGPILDGPCLSLREIPSSIGGGFLVSSSSPISPTGVSVQTDSMLMEGALALTGRMPFLGVVALEGPLPAVGQGAVAYGCGNGNIGILNEVAPEAVGPGPAGYGFGPASLGFNGYPRVC